jgi:integrase
VEAAARELHLIKHGVKVVAPTGTTPTLDAFWERFLTEHVEANRLKPSTRAGFEQVYKHNIKPELGELPLSNIDDASIQRLKASMANVSAKTLNNTLSVLSTMLKCAVEWGVLSAMPCRVRLVKRAPPEMRFFDFEDFDRLVDAAERIDLRIQVLVLLGGRAGLRCGELLGLRWSDLDLPRAFVNVQRSVWKGHVTPPKGGKSRVVKIPSVLVEALRSLRAQRPEGEECVLYRTDGRGVVGRALLVKWLKRAQVGAELDATGALHQLRHSYGSHLAALGVPARAIQEAMGHESLATCERYLHLGPHARDAVAQAFERPRARVLSAVS